MTGELVPIYLINMIQITSNLFIEHPNYLDNRLQGHCSFDIHIIYSIGTNFILRIHSHVEIGSKIYFSHLITKHISIVVMLKIFKNYK